MKKAGITRPTRLASVLTFLIAIVGNAGTFAAEPTQPLALEDLIKLALENNPGIAARRWSAKAAEHEIDEAKGKRLPVLTFKPSYRYDPAESKRRIARSDLEDLRKKGKVFDDQILDVGMVLKMPLYTGGRITASIELKQLKHILSKNRLEQTRNDLVLNVTSAYYNIVKLRKIAEVTKATRNRLLEAKRIVETRLARQSGDRDDLLKINRRVARLDQAIMKAQNGIELVYIVLNSFLGKDPTEKKLALIEDLPRLIDPMNLECDIPLAVDKSPAYQIAKKQVEIQEKKVEIEKSKRWPQISVVGNVKEVGGGKDFFPMTHDRTIGLRLSMPIFDESLRARISKERAKLLEQKEKLRQKRLKAAVQVKRAQLLAKQAEKRARTAEEARKEAAETMNAAERKFETGQISVESLLKAQAAHLQAEVKCFQALASLYIKRAAFRRASGETKL